MFGKLSFLFALVIVIAFLLQTSFCFAWSSDNNLSISTSTTTPPLPVAAATPTPAAQRQPQLLLHEHPKFKLLPSRSICGLVEKLRTVNLRTNRRRKRVTGGRIAHPGYLPGIAKISTRDPEDNDDVFYVNGAGALINSKYVLTTASSFAGIRDTLDTVGFRSALKTDNIYSYAIDSVVIHPGYANKMKANDIALIRLSDSVHFNSTQMPVCLPIDEDDSARSAEDEIESSNAICSNGSVITAGWGRTQEDDLGVPLYPNYIEMKFRPSNHCDRVYSRKLGKLTRGQICASSCLGEGTGLCGGTDESAVLMKSEELSASEQFTLIGLASHFDRCGNYGLPAVFTRVKHFMPWILDNIRP